MDADPRSPERAAASAFPAVAYGSASTVRDFGACPPEAGLSRSVPPVLAAFGPPDSCPPRADESMLRPGRLPTQTQDLSASGGLGPSPGVARPSAGGTLHAAAPTQITDWKAPTWPGARHLPFHILSLKVGHIYLM